MALIKCPECQKEVSDNVGSCPNCGCPINDETTEKGKTMPRRCPECGKELEIGKTLCQNCGYDSVIVNTRNSFINFNNKICILISCVAVIAAIILFVNGYEQTHNSKFEFYEQHYEECMDGFYENRESAKSSGGYIKSTYNYISEQYKQMADDDEAKIKEYKKKGIILYFLGCIVVVGAVVIVKKGGDVSGTN